MAFKEFFKQDILSDLVAHWGSNPYDSYTHRVINVDTSNLPNPQAGLPMGVVVFRVKNDTDLTAPYAPVNPGNAATALVAGNELAIVWGDKWKAQEVVEVDPSGTTKCQSFTRGDIQIKDKLPMLYCGITDRTSAEYKALQALFENQDGVILVPELDQVPYGV